MFLYEGWETWVVRRVIFVPKWFSEALSDLKIEVLGLGLGFSPTSLFINEADLKRDFADFSRNMKCTGYFRNLLLKTLVKLQLLTISQLGVHHQGIGH